MPYTPEIDLESLTARRDMGTLLSSRDGGNLMGELQEAPPDDPYLRHEVFEDRLSQSGTTYGEHSSSSIAPRGLGVTGELPKGINLGDRTKPDFAELRRQEIARSVDLQERMVKALGSKEPDVTLAKSKLEALKKDQQRINDALNDRETIKNRFMSQEGSGGTWSGAKKKAGTDPEAMKEARWQRQEFMETALTNTAGTFLKQAAGKMGVDANIVELRPPPPSKPPGENATLEDLQKYEKELARESQYLDGRVRRFQLQITDEEQQKKYGKTLTVSFLAPGSTEDTSDIDMQFIVEENPSMCSELIKTFQVASQEELSKLGLGDKSLAKRFDMNPYPAGFVFRPELGSDLHFSETYTQESLNNKKIVDGGLALLRRLDSMEDPEKEIQAMVDQVPEGPARQNLLRSLSIGAELSLQAQVERGTALQSKLKGELLKQSPTLSKSLELAGKPESPKMWKEKDAPSVKDIAEKMKQSQKLAGVMHDISELSGGSEALAEARNEVYLKSLKKVEVLTVERDKAVAELGDLILQEDKMITQVGKEIQEVDKLLKEKPTDATLLKQRRELVDSQDEMIQNRKQDVALLRQQTSDIGVDSFMAQGVALHHADEAYTNRGAIGHVVEQQMGRKFVATTGSAISSIEANHGFILEHFEEDLGHQDLTKVTGTDLAKFAQAVGKYAERIGQGMETVNPRSVVGKKMGETFNDDMQKTGVIRKEAPHEKLVQLGKDLASIKKGVDPTSGEAITDPSLKTGMVTEALKRAGIENAQQFKDMLDNAVSESWKTHLTNSVKPPQVSVAITPEQLELQRSRLKATQKREVEPESVKSEHSVRSMLHKFESHDTQGDLGHSHNTKPGSLRNDPRMAKFNHMDTEKSPKQTVKTPQKLVH